MPAIWLRKNIKQNYLFVVLGILAFIMHFAFLSSPNQVIFDEVHFGKFISAYFNHEYYFDIHPPLGKLMIAAWAKLANTNFTFNFDKIGDAGDSQLFFNLRFMPAFFGSIFILLFSWFAYLITRSKQIALIAGTLILVDNGFLVQSRIIAIDIFLVFFEILTLCFFLIYQRQKSFSRRWVIFLLLTGIGFGLAVSIKWAGLATAGIIILTLLAKPFSRKLADWLNYKDNSANGPFQDKSNERISRNHKKDFIAIGIKEAIVGIVVIPAIGFLIYLIPFYVHFNILNRPGTGDIFMSREFQDELKNENKKNESHPLSFWDKFKELNIAMYDYNFGLTDAHPFSSKWSQWPLDNKPIYYWYQDLTPKNGGIGKIYFLGNPILWWLAFGAIIFTVIRIISKKQRKKIKPFMYFLLLAYFANLLPFIAIGRATFLYHYMLSVSFAIILLSVYLEELRKKDVQIFNVLMIAIAGSFIIIVPLSYGWFMTSEINHFEMQIIDFLS